MPRETPKSNLRVNFTGVSGVGKTTLAKWVSEEFNIPFVSGSYSDLIPATKDMPHQDMINQDPQKVYMQDTQVLNLRNKKFQEYSSFVSDRSYLDSAAYLINKLSHRIKECDTETFLELCQALSGTQITHLIFIPFTKEYIKGWEMEDNHKRILNRYYQWEVSTIMYRILYEFWGFQPSLFHTQSYDMGTVQIDHQGRIWTTKVLILKTMDLEERKDIIDTFLSAF